MRGTSCRQSVLRSSNCLRVLWPRRPWPADTSQREADAGQVRRPSSRSTILRTGRLEAPSDQPIWHTPDAYQ